MPTVIAIDKASDNLATPRMLSGFRAFDRHEDEFKNLHIIDNLKNRVATPSKQREITIGDHCYPIEGLVANFLATLRKHAKELAQIPIDQQGITITVPAKSGTLQRMTMRFAARIAGFQGTIDLIEEPVAAFLYHRHRRPDFFQSQHQSPQYVMIIDFGGGTCDLAIVQSEKNKLPRVVGRAMARFGGETIDAMFLKKFWLETYQSKNKPEPEKPLMHPEDYNNADIEIQMLLSAYARRAKEYLSDTNDNSYAPSVRGEFLKDKVAWHIAAIPIMDGFLQIRFFITHFRAKYGNN